MRYRTPTMSSGQRWSLAARWFPLAGVVGPLLFVLVFTLAGFLRPRYSPLRQAVSDLGVGPSAWLANANFVVFGLLLTVFAIGFYQGMHSLAVMCRGPLIVCLVFLTLSGIGIVNGGLFTEDATTVILHWIGGFLLAFLSPLIVFFLVGWYSLITGVLTGALMASLFVFLAPSSPLPIGGLLQRLLVVECFAWHVVMGWRLFLRGGSSQKKTVVTIERESA
jgi:hypothetical membrane protein